MRTLGDISEAERRRPISVLALGKKAARLEQGGFGELGNVLDDAARDFEGLRRLPALGQRFLMLVRERIGAVLSCACPSGEVDWDAFRRLCGLTPNENEVTHQPLSEKDRAITVRQLHLGARTERIMAGGLTTVGCLIDDEIEGFPRLRQVPYLGQAAVTLAERRLRSLDACRGPNGAVDWATFAALCTGQIIAPPSTLASSHSESNLPAFSAAAKAMPVEVLRLGPKAKFLRQAGLSTIGHLAQDGVQRRFPKLAGLGPGTARIICSRLADLAASVDEAGEPQWDRVAASWGFPVTPVHPLPTGETFLGVAVDVIDQWIEAHEGEADRLILKERLMRSREERLTLDELGRRLGLTRERVRQKEKALLDGLCDALLANDQSRSPVQFSVDFRSWWERAGSAYVDAATLSFPRFVNGLERAWGVSASRLTVILPLALAVLTDGEQVVPPRMPIHPRLLEPLAPSLLRMPIRSLPVGKALDDLEAAGCTSVGALLLAAMESRLPQGRSSAVSARILTATAHAVDAEGRLDLGRFASALKMPLLPQKAPLTPDAFLRVFDEAAEAAVGLGRTTERAAAIWRVRTRLPAAIRPTLDETAALLGTWGSTVKREETLLLASLNAQLVEEELVNAGVVWRREFLDWVREAEAEHEAAGSNFDSFIRTLAVRWEIGAERLRIEAAGLWAVLSLYPNGRRKAVRTRRGAEATAAPTVQPEVAQIIVLRGFRRPH